MDKAWREHLSKAGKIGGRSRSAKKLQAIRANLKKANAAKAKLRRAS